MINREHKLPSGDLASRQRAIGQRRIIVQQLKENEHLLINCGDVLSMSESYADEIFGVLVVEQGLDYVLENITIVNASRSVLKQVASVIDRRNKELLHKSH